MLLLFVKIVPSVTQQKLATTKNAVPPNSLKCNAYSFTCVHRTHMHSKENGAIRILSLLPEWLFRYNVLKPLYGHIISAFDKNVLLVESAIYSFEDVSYCIHEASFHDTGKTLSVTTLLYRPSETVTSTLVVHQQHLSLARSLLTWEQKRDTNNEAKSLTIPIRAVSTKDCNLHWW